MKIELRNCPFCGVAPEIQPWHGGQPTKVMISCPSEYETEDGGCSVGPQVTGSTLAKAAKRWNKRDLFGNDFHTHEYDTSRRADTEHLRGQSATAQTQAQKG